MRAYDRQAFDMTLNDLRGAHAREMDSKVSNARTDEQRRIRERRAGGINAVKVFLYELDTASKELGRDLEFNTDPGLAGTILVRRRSADATILLPFPSLEKEEYQKDAENRFFLYFQCRPDSGNCITIIGKDGSLRVASNASFLIPQQQTDALVKAARGARLAFTD